MGFITSGAGSGGLGTAGTKGWSVFARGNSYAAAGSENDLGIGYWDGTSWRDSIRFDALTGNVGIGTTSPGRLLGVAGAMRLGPIATPSSPAAGDLFVDSTAGNALKYHNGSAWVSVGNGNTTSSGTANYLGKFTGANSLGNSVLYETGGNVGLGTTSPSRKLAIVDDTSPLMSIGTSAGSGGAYLLGNANHGLQRGPTGGSLGFTPAVNDVTLFTSGTGFVHLATGTTSTAVPRLTIDISGNVGIGTTSPVQKLDVAGTIKAGATYSTSGSVLLVDTHASGNLTTIGTEYSSGGPSIGYGVVPSTAAAGSFNSAYSLVLGRSAMNLNGDFRFYTGATQTVAIGSPVTMSEKMRIDNTGNVGIGTTSPTYTLDLASATNSSQLHLNNAGTDVGGYFIGNSTGLTVSGNASYNGSNWIAKATTASLIQSVGVIKFNTNSSLTVGGAYTPTERMRIDTSGNVGIGTTAPDERLVVYNGTTTGKYTTSGWTHTSDIRLKHDVLPLENSLEKIVGLQGVEYKFNADPEDKKQIGFIAQQVEPIFPEVVKTDKNGFKSMVYGNLVAPLVESVKALYHRLVAVEGRQALQDREIASVKAELDAKARRLESENAQLKQENAAKAKELEAVKARLDKIEKMLDSK